jgi:hypothetical protein
MSALLVLLRVEMNQEVAGYQVAFVHRLAPSVVVADDRGVGKEQWATRKGAWERAGFRVLSYTELL